MSSIPGSPSCNPHGDPPISGDCWYNCTSDDIAGEDKRRRLRKVTFLFCSFACLNFMPFMIFFCCLYQFNVGIVSIFSLVILYIFLIVY